MPERSATLYRRMLEDAGFEIDEHLLTSRDGVEEFKAEQRVATTPVIFIDGQRIDGREQLADYLEAANEV